MRKTPGQVPRGLNAEQLWRIDCPWTIPRTDASLPEKAFALKPFTRQLTLATAL